MKHINNEIHDETCRTRTMCKVLWDFRRGSQFFYEKGILEFPREDDFRRMSQINTSKKLLPF